MSEIGIISQEYKNTAGLFQKINQAVIVLKKDSYGTNSVSPSSTAVKEAKSLLNKVLASIVMMLGDDFDNVVSDGELISIPPFFISRIQESRQGDLKRCIEDIQELQLRLQDNKDNKVLDINSFKILDEICGQLDAETSKLYRKMRRR